MVSDDFALPCTINIYVRLAKIEVTSVKNILCGRGGRKDIWCSSNWNGKHRCIHISTICASGATYDHLKWAIVVHPISCQYSEKIPLSPRHKRSNLHIIEYQTGGRWDTWVQIFFNIFLEFPVSFGSFGEILKRYSVGQRALWVMNFLHPFLQTDFFRMELD